MTEKRSNQKAKEKTTVSEEPPPKEPEEPMEVDRQHDFIDDEGGIRIGDIYIPPPPPPACTFDSAGPRLVITHIENYNFKSYAGKQVLGPFHKNFTSIVGPNGSGKSNVIDSMLFVFGYRSQRIRSKKLSALIHNSNEHKNLASCSVHVYFQEVIDKSDDEFEVVPSSEFVVSRSASKDNSSFYTINGKKVFFKEVGKLLRLHGVDLDHNRFLILQGEVEQIAMMKAKAQTEHDTGMLEFLEDIIGCSRFKEPIALFVKKVEELNEQRTEKLNRVKVVEKEKDELEAAKNDALEYLKLENEVLMIDNKLFQMNKHYAEAAKMETVEKKETLLEEMKSFLQKLEDLKVKRTEQEKMYNERKKVRDKCLKLEEEKKDEYTALERKDLQCREDHKHAKNKAKNLTKTLESEQQKLKDYQAQPAKSEKLIEELQKKKGTLEKQVEQEQAKLEKVMASMQVETAGLQAKKDQLEIKLMELQKDVNDTNSKLKVHSSELELYLSTEQNEQKKLVEFQLNLDKTKEELAHKNRLLEDLKKRMPAAERQLQKIQTDLPRIVEAETNLKNEFRTKRCQMEETRCAMQATKSKSRVLQVLLQQRDQGKIPGIFGRLGDLGAIDAKYDVAISTACGPLDNIVTDTMDTAQTCVQFLKDNNVGRATFIALDKMQRHIPDMRQQMITPENVPRLFDLIRVNDERVLPAFYFGVRNTLVADNLDQATRIGLQGRTRHRVVTLKGELIDISGTMSGGGTQVSRGRMAQAVVENAASAQEVEAMVQDIEVMGQRLEGLRQQIDDMQLQQTQLGRDHQIMKESHKKLTSEVKILLEKEPTLAHKVQQQTEKVNGTHVDQQKVGQMQSTIDKSQKEYDEAASKSAKVEAEVQKLNNKIRELTGGKMEACQRALTTFNNQIDALVVAMTKAGVATKTAQRNTKKCEDKIASLEKEIEENQLAKDKLLEDFKVLEGQAKAIMAELEKSKKEREAIEEAMEEIRIEASALKEQEQGHQSKNIELKNQLKELDESINKHDKKVKDQQYRLSKLKLHEVEGETSKELPQLTVEELENVDPETVNYSRASLQENLKKMKPNMAAIAEYKKKENQYLQRVSELDTITEERDTQRGHYDSLRKQRLTDFMDGFSIITTKLKETYQMLTLGGDAELELVDSLDPFSEGIIFSVRPPKKSWKNISNLSGGEKTLSSLALVFALHFYRPTSLYVMDEIDAALDFKNVSIVGHYIKERTKNAQFIVISLRNNMFELADRLVGIYKTRDCTKSVTINPTVLEKNQVIV